MPLLVSLPPELLIPDTEAIGAPLTCDVGLLDSGTAVLSLARVGASR